MLIAPVIILYIQVGFLLDISNRVLICFAQTSMQDGLITLPISYEITYSCVCTHRTDQGVATFLTLTSLSLSSFNVFGYTNHNQALNNIQCNYITIGY